MNETTDPKGKIGAPADIEVHRKLYLPPDALAMVSVGEVTYDTPQFVPWDEP